MNRRKISAVVPLSYLFLAAALLTAPPAARGAEKATVASPGGDVTIICELADGRPAYSVRYRGRTVVDSSPLGLAFGTDAPAWTMAGREPGDVDSRWEPVFGKRSTVRNRYRSLRVSLARAAGEPAAMDIVFRAYDDGAAFRYVVGPRDTEPATVTIAGDRSAFNLPAGSTGWCYNREHRPKGPFSLKDTGGGLQLPVLVDAGDGAWLAVAEAALYGFPPFRPTTAKGSAAVGVEIDTAAVQTPFATPWRVVMLGDHPGRLVDSDLMANLNPPCKNEEFTWLKSGVSFWDWRAIGYRADDGFVYGQDFETWKRFIDLGAETGVPFLLIDANWYGPEFSGESDPFTGGKSGQVRRAIDYGKKKGVGLVLYLNHVAGKKFGTEKIVAAYAKWGAAGIKYGFMRGLRGRDKVNYTRKIITACAKNRLSVNFHDGPVPPSGDERTWPNCQTREYCHAQSDAKRSFSPGTFILQAYVNNLMGPIDMDNGMFDLNNAMAPRPRVFAQVYSTIVAEAARTLIIYSGLTVIPDAAGFYRKHGELFGFIAAQKQPWRESRTLAGEMGEYIVTMRRTGDTFLVAAATDEEARTVGIPLDFLPDGEYATVIHRDAADAHYKTNREAYETEKRAATAKDTIEAAMAPGGGFCMTIRPKGK